VESLLGQVPFPNEAERFGDVELSCRSVSEGYLQNVPVAESKEDRGGRSAKSEPKAQQETIPAPAKAIDADPSALAERGKSRGGTRGGKPTQASTDTGLSRSVAAPNLDVYIERCDGSEALTQELLGAIITKPKLSEKLLQKPPVRFLHDIVSEIIKVTGFGSGLYTEAELDSANVTEKQQKIDFLEKIIKFVGTHLNTLVEAQPLKIVAGMDAANTNRFLQLLAVAAKHVPDSSQTLRSMDSTGGPTPSVAAPAAAPAPGREDKRQEEKPKRSVRL
jgi:hypothetical protein